MTWGLTIGVLLAAASALAALQPARAQEHELQIDWDLETRTVTWTSVEGAVTYEITGTVAYHHFGSCTPGLDPAVSDTVKVDETVGPSTTSFDLPPPDNPAADSIKDMEVIITAVAADGELLDQNGFALTADKFCTEEEIAAELAAAGTGGPTEGSSVPAIFAVALAAVGSLALIGGIALRRRVAA